MYINAKCTLCLYYKFISVRYSKNGNLCNHFSYAVIQILVKLHCQKSHNGIGAILYDSNAVLAKMHKLELHNAYGAQIA